MNCPVCGEKTKVVDSRSDCESVWRKRQCMECEYTFKTIELEEVFVDGGKDDDKDRGN